MTQYCGRLQSVKYLAIKKPGDEYFTWYEKGQPVGSSAVPDGVSEVVYFATGETVSREDGELAEIYSPAVVEREAAK